MATAPASVELTPTPTLVGKAPVQKKQADEPQPLASAAPLHKYLLLTFFCLGQFLNTLNNSAVLPALPSITHNVHLTESDTVWLLAAYQATFASFLLISGHVLDIYSPKPMFIIGTTFFRAISLRGGFVNDCIVLIVLQALQGIGASLTIPSALSLLVQMFPEPAEQARVIGLFGATAAIGNILGTMVGAIFVQYVSWQWIFWLITMIVLLIAAVCIYLIPTTPHHKDTKVSQLDFVGISTLTAAIILFVYMLTTGSISPWASAGVLVLLFISVALVIAFFIWEIHIGEKNTALPPKLWFYPNFAVLFAVALMPYFWWIQIYLTFSPYWQDVLHWSSIITGIKFLPLGIVGGFIMSNGRRIARLGRPKILILGSLSLSLAASLMLPFTAQLRNQYLPLVFPAFIIGTVGTAVVFVLTNIVFFRTTPPKYAGT
ncbi:hypothetical protein FRC06_011738, partial [Ceratobasidium sp. 370]